MNPIRRCTEVKEKIATKTSDIFNGNLIISPLSLSSDAIGKQDVECQHCGALRFKAEHDGICCGVGKVNLPLFPQPPQPLLDLWISQSQEAKLFRENCRSIHK